MMSISTAFSSRRASIRTSGRSVHWTKFLILLLLTGCVADPTMPDGGIWQSGTSGGVMVVNEGQWGQDNSSLTHFNPSSGEAVTDYFSISNPGLRLGDLANSITLFNGRAYIAVTTSRAIEVVDLATGRSLGRVRLDGALQPRQIAIADGTHGWATTLADSVIEFNPSTLNVTRSIAVGPAPDGIAVAGGRLFVANSGFGLLRQNEPEAGTISVIDVAGGDLVATIRDLPNVRRLHHDPDADRLYALYGLPESPGGLAEIDLSSLKELRRWSVNNTVDAVFDDASRLVYIAGGDGVVRIDLMASREPERFIDSSSWPGSIFYSLGVSPSTGNLYIGRMKGYSPLPAEVIIYDRRGSLKGRFPCGIYPGDFAFY